MIELIFASSNAHKSKELISILPNNIQLKNLKDIGYTNEIEETGNTLKENALIKAKTIYEFYGIACLADDSGLEIPYLKGEPGVKSARYAGEPSNDKLNIEKVLDKLKHSEERNAVFKTVICLCLDGNYHYFEGEVKGRINHQPVGLYGFGYDPIFIPEGYNMTFAEMMLDQKNQLSHRKKALEKLIQFLKIQL